MEWTEFMESAYMISEVPWLWLLPGFPTVVSLQDFLSRVCPRMSREMQFLQESVATFFTHKAFLSFLSVLKLGEIKFTPNIFFSILLWVQCFICILSCLEAANFIYSLSQWLNSWRSSSEKDVWGVRRGKPLKNSSCIHFTHSHCVLRYHHLVRWPPAYRIFKTLFYSLDLCTLSRSSVTAGCM
jgi:hypothetical protein